MSDETPKAQGAPAQPAITKLQADMLIESNAFLGLLVIVAILGVILSIAAWLYLEGTIQLQRTLFTRLPHGLGYENGPPNWYYLVVLAVGGLLVALALLLPGRDTHIPAEGLSVAPTPPLNLPCILLAAAAAISFGLLLGPEVPLIVLGGSLSVLLMRVARPNTPPQVLAVIAAAGSFATVSFIFGSPLIAAIILIEATGLGGPMTNVILLPGLTAAGIGSLVSIGIGKVTGLSNSAYALGPLPLQKVGRPTVVEFFWTIAFAAVFAVATHYAMRGGMFTWRFVSRRQMLVVLPLIALIVAVLGIVFTAISGKPISNVLFDGQDQLPGLVLHAGAWSVGTLTLLIACKGIAYTLSLGSFRGGPTFPALFLGAAAGILVSHLPGFSESAAVAVGIGAAITCVLRLPLSAAFLSTILCSHGAGIGIEPLIIVGVVFAYIMTIVLARWHPKAQPAESAPAAAAQPPSTPAPRPAAPEAVQAHAGRTPGAGNPK